MYNEINKVSPAAANYTFSTFTMFYREIKTKVGGPKAGRKKKKKKKEKEKEKKRKEKKRKEKTLESEKETGVLDIESNSKEMLMD